MGLMTRAQLLRDGGLSAGNDIPSTYVRNWLDAWLQRTAKSWSWPILRLSVTDVLLSAGSTNVVVGAATQGNEVFLHRILGGYILFRSSDYKTRGRMLVRPLLEGDPDVDERTTQASDRMGIPSTVKVRKGNQALQALDGCFTLYPDPVPNMNLYLSFDAHRIPPNIGEDEDDDDEFPWYPNDRTLQQAVKCATLEQDDGGEGRQNLDQELDRLGRMVVDDRDFDGEAPGDNNMMELDKNTFR